MKRLFSFFTLVMLTTASAVSASPLVSNERSCFSGPYSTYEGFAALTEKRFNMVSKKRKLDREFSRQRFENDYPPEHFENVKANVECVDFLYEVDGYTVGGYYLRPKRSDKPLPVIIFNRGGNGSFGQVRLGKKLRLLSKLAQQGYLVIGSQYRGSMPRVPNNGKDEFGGADINDVLALRNIIASMPEADANNVSMMGWSRGVMQSYQVAKQMPELKALIAVAGNSDAARALQLRPKMENVYKHRAPNFATDRDAQLVKRSAILWVDELPKSMPILLLHGTDDWRVDYSQSENMAAALKAQSHPHKLVIYEGDDHGLTKNRSAMEAEVLAWLDAHMRAG